MTVLTPSRPPGPSTPGSSSRLGSVVASSRLRDPTPARSGTPTPTSRSIRAGSLLPSDASLRAILSDSQTRANKLDADRRDSSRRLLDAWTAIGERYGAVDPEEDDEVDIVTGEIVVDRGRLREMKSRAMGRALWDGESEGEEDDEYEDVDDSEELEGEAVELEHLPVELDAGADILDAWGDDSRHDLQVDYNVPDYLLEHLDKPKPVPAWTKEDDEDLKAFLRIEEEKRAQRGEQVAVEDELELKGLPDRPSPPKLRNIPVKAERASTPMAQEPLLTSRKHGTVHLPSSSVAKSSSPREQDNEDPLSDPTAGTSPVTAIDLSRLRLGSSAPRPIRPSFAHLFRPLPPASESKIKMGSPAPTFAPRISSPLAHPPHDSHRLQTPSSPLNPQAAYRKHAPAASSQLAKPERLLRSDPEVAAKRESPGPLEVKQEDDKPSRSGEFIGVVITRKASWSAVKREDDVFLPPNAKVTTSWQDIDMLKAKALAQAEAAAATPSRDFSALGGGWGEVSRVSGRQRKHISETKEYKTFYLMPLKKRPDRRSSGAAAASPETSANGAQAEATSSATRRRRMRDAGNPTLPASASTSESRQPPNGFGTRPPPMDEISITSPADLSTPVTLGVGRPRKRCQTCVTAGRTDRAIHCIGRKTGRHCDFVKDEEDADDIQQTTIPADNSSTPAASVRRGKTKDNGPSPMIREQEGLNFRSLPAWSTRCGSERTRGKQGGNRRPSLGERHAEITSRDVSSPTQASSSPAPSKRIRAEVSTSQPASASSRRVQRNRPSRVKSEDHGEVQLPAASIVVSSKSRFEAAPMPEDLPQDTVAEMMELAAAEVVPLEDGDIKEEATDAAEPVAMQADDEDDILLLGRRWFDSSPAAKAGQPVDPAPSRRSTRPSKRKTSAPPPLLLKRAKREESVATPPKGWNPRMRYIPGTEIIDLEDYVPLGEVSDDELDSW